MYPSDKTPPEAYTRAQYAAECSHLSVFRALNDALQRDPPESPAEILELLGRARSLAPKLAKIATQKANGHAARHRGYIPNTPRTWGEMTPPEQAWLTLAAVVRSATKDKQHADTWYRRFFGPSPHK